MARLFLIIINLQGREEEKDILGTSSRYLYQYLENQRVVNPKKKKQHNISSKF